MVRKFAFGLALFGVAAIWAQPRFTREGFVPAQLMRPGDLATIYGSELAPRESCQKVYPSSSYPTERCGVQVLVGGKAAGLLYVSPVQINLEIPKDVPAVGDLPVVVMVEGRSSAAVPIAFGEPKTILSLEGQPYVDMPVWIHIERARSSEIRYPYSLQAESFGGSKFEVRRNGVTLSPRVSQGPGVSIVTGFMNGSIAPEDSPRSRLPLHLQFRFDQPGTYSVRYTATEMRPTSNGISTVELDQSDWFDIHVLASSKEQRAKWVAEELKSAPSKPGEIVGDFLPSVLASPDAAVLAAVLRYSEDNDELVRRYAAYCLRYFDRALVQASLKDWVARSGVTPALAEVLGFYLDASERNKLALAAEPGLDSSAGLKAAGAFALIRSTRIVDGKVNPLSAELSGAVIRAAPGVLRRGDAGALQELALNLGGIPTRESRDLLWKMVEAGAAAEQAQTCIAWLKFPDDLPLLARLLMSVDPEDPLGNRTSSLVNVLRSNYGDAALPYVREAMDRSPKQWVRTSSARELVGLDEPRAYAFVVAAVEGKKSYAGEMLQVVRDRNVGLGKAADGEVLEFARRKAASP